MRRALLVVATVIGLLAASGSPVSAGDLPQDRFHLKSITLDPRTGSVEVAARTSCTGNGTMSWEASLRQNARGDRGSRRVPCDGVVRAQTLTLQPKSGRFHAGQAEFTIGDIVCGTNVCIGAARGGFVRLLPHQSADGV